MTSQQYSNIYLSARLNPKQII